LEASEPAAVPVVRALLQALVADVRCGAVCVVANNVALGDLRSTFDMLKFLEQPRHKRVLESIPQMDVALAMVGPTNSPSRLLLCSAKSVFGCTRLFFYASGVQSVTVDLRDAVFWKSADPVDAVLVSNTFTASLYQSRIPKGATTVVPVGSTLLDALLGEDAALLQVEARQVLGINPGAQVLFYPCFPSSDYVPLGCASDVAYQCLLQTLDGVVLAAQDAPERPHALVVRSHPRGSQGEKEQLEQLSRRSLPGNLKLLIDPVVSYDTCVQAADAVACVGTSTLMLVAPNRGQQVLVLAYDDGGLRVAFEHLFSHEERAVFAQAAEFSVVHNSNELAFGLGIATVPRPRSPEGRSTERILERLLG